VTIQTVETTFHLRAGTPEQWATANPILDLGEPGLEHLGGGKFKVKFGDGVRHWDNLPYFSDLVAHVNDDTPHPAYDDIPSLASFYQNQKV
jgi:hypothetical protein